MTAFLTVSGNTELAHNFRITWVGYTASDVSSEVVMFDNQAECVAFIAELLTAGVIDFRLTHNVKAKKVTNG